MKRAQCDKTQSRELRTARLSVLHDCARLQYIVHNTTQNSSDNLRSYLQTNIVAQMLSIGGEGHVKHTKEAKQTCKCNAFVIRRLRWLIDAQIGGRKRCERGSAPH